MRTLVGLCLCVLLAVSLHAQQNIFWSRDHIYANGKEVATVTPQPSDQTAPTAPTGLNYSNVTATSATLSWSASSDSGGSQLQRYIIYRQIGSGPSLPVGTVNAGTVSFTDPHLQPSVSYNFTVRAFDGAQNLSVPSNTVSFTTSSTASDTTAPSVLINLTGRGLSATSIQLNWAASTDAGGSGVRFYHVYRDGGYIATTSNASLVDATGLAANTSYSYTVAAVDVAGNTSAQSTAVAVLTKRTIVFSDNFNRADTNNLFNTNWQTTFWGISLNTAVLPKQYTLAWRDALSATTQTHFQVTAKILHNPYWTGLAFWGDNLTGRYRAYFWGTSLVLSWFDSQNNEALVTSVQNVGTTPRTLVVLANSSTRNIQVFVDGVQKINFSETDTSRTNSGRIGLTAYLQSGSTTDAMIDDFTLEQ